MAAFSRDVERHGCELVPIAGVVELVADVNEYLH